MSACDTCFDPGRCCRSLGLTKTYFQNTMTDRQLEARRREQVRSHATMRQVFPFVIVSRDGDNYPVWSCPALAPDGRCSVYAKRPELCRRYEPGTDDLCVHSRGTTAGDASAGEMPWALYRPPSDGLIVDAAEPWPGALPPLSEEKSW